MLRKLITYAIIIGLAVVTLKLFFGADEFADAKARVAAQLKDPASAEFKDINQVGDRVCGEVNARNSFGGYTGFVPFYIRGEEVLLGQPDSEPSSLLQNATIRVKCVKHLTAEAT